MLAFYYQMLKLDKPHASTKYIVLWVLQVRNVLTVLPLSCFAGFFLWVIVTFIPPELALWMYGGSCSKLVQVVSYGQGHHRCTIYLYFFAAI
jgi:hypothetical protein